MWILAEGTASFGGMPFTSMMTLGYDPRKKAYVGTWVDTLQTHLWTYVGQLDDSGRQLTLDTEGPGFNNPSKMARYRDAFEVKGPDHLELSSSVQNSEGTWNTFMRAQYRRRK